jgi:hypothetical protein
MLVAAGARMGESECKEGLQVRKGPGKLARLTAEVGSSPALSLSSPEPWREVGDAPDGRVPPVSVRVREKEGPQRTRSARENSRAVLGRVRAGRQHCTVHFFFFLFV